MKNDLTLFTRLANIGYEIAEKEGKAVYCLSEGGLPYVFAEEGANRAKEIGLISEICFSISAKEFATLERPAKFIFNQFQKII